MKSKKLQKLGIHFVNKGFPEVVDFLSEQIQRERKTFLVTANPEIVMYARENSEYRDLVQTADLVVPDGFGIILASKILKSPIQERVTGYDLTIRLLELANQNQWRIYLLGGQDRTNKKAIDHIRNQFPNVMIAGSHHGFFDWNKNTISEEIRASEPDIVFVALGFPKQEKWIAENISKFSKGLFIGVGGSIDVLAGEVKRAPEIWQKMNLEWFYRLLMQPSRWRRMLALPQFLIEIFKIKLK
ncbi:MAG: WecB/TagA/CpsF family glycosyltransferase [Bacillota bacterium]|nr:WecB/TagA/CpsF family glycosyltransferase [Bacillota bacterium]